MSFVLKRQCIKIDEWRIFIRCLTIKVFEAFDSFVTESIKLFYCGRDGIWVKDLTITYIVNTLLYSKLNLEQVISCFIKVIHLK